MYSNLTEVLLRDLANIDEEIVKADKDTQHSLMYLQETLKDLLEIAEHEDIDRESAKMEAVNKALGVPTLSEITEFERQLREWEAQGVNSEYKPKEPACDCDCDGCTDGSDEDEEVELTFTQAELFAMAQVLGFVDKSPEIYSVMQKLSSRLHSEEELEEGFSKVDLVVESDLPMLDKPIPMQENWFNLQIRDQ